MVDGGEIDGKRRIKRVRTNENDSGVSDEIGRSRHQRLRMRCTLLRSGAGAS